MKVKTDDSKKYFLTTPTDFGYEINRFRLLRKSVLVFEIIKALESKIKNLKSLKSELEAKKKLDEINNKIKLVSQRLDVYIPLITSIKEIPKRITFYSKIRLLLVVDENSEPISEPGLYARFYPGMRKKDWDDLYDMAIKTIGQRKWLIKNFTGKAITSMAKPYEEKAEKRLNSDRQRLQTGYLEKDYSRGFLKVEKEIYNVWGEKETVNKEFELRDDKIKSIVDGALERCIDIGHIDYPDTKAEDEAKAKYRRAYEETSKRYNLLTLHNFPKLLRQISG